jgi:hypothetical protein
MRYCLIQLVVVLLFLIPFNLRGQQDQIQWKVYDSKAVGIRWKMPASWKITETHNDTIIRIDFIIPDTTINAWLQEYKEIQGEISDVTEKITQEISFSEINRLTKEINGIECTILTGQASIDEELINGDINIFRIGEERYLIFCVFINENTNRNTQTAVFQTITQSFELIMNADDVEDETPSEKGIEDSAKEEDEDQ